ncbi:MAG: DHH family phosphoesterase, partial [Clostridiales bacterium]|nr:DHH family phosphoesterase [Clostridiales bacterium]
EIETDADFPTSLSIGIGIGGKNLLEQDSFALAAQEMALGRGGDQAVVKKKNKFEYYGGKSQAVERTTKGKSRIMAHALRQLVDQSSGVIIMGHRNPDMDALGAALGIYRIVRNRGKEAVIVTNSYSSTMDAIYQKVRDSKNYRLATNEEALNMIDRESLLVVVDAHRAVLLECPELLEKTDKLVLIDHHRRAEDCLEQPTLSYMEPYASSTSELVAEMLQYITAETNRPIDKLEAEALLAGITVDTNNFTVKTGIRTFDAASWLRRMGADTANIRQLLRTDAESFRLRSEVLSRAVILRDRFAVSYYEEAHPEIQILSAQAADDLLTIKGVVASFVAGPSLSGQTVISARSLGQLNVQVIMEKLGGGGHLTTAGTQLNMPLEEALAALKDLINSVEITD